MSKKLGRALLVLVAGLALWSSTGKTAEAAGLGQPTDWNRFYYYPYVYYPQNFRQEKPLDHMYYRYPPSMRIPVYNKNWHNFYPSPRPYHRGHHFILDVF